VQSDFHDRRTSVKNPRRGPDREFINITENENLLIGVGETHDGLLEDVPDFDAFDCVGRKLPPAVRARRSGGHLLHRSNVTENGSDRRMFP